MTFQTKAALVAVGWALTACAPGSAVSERPRSSSEESGSSPTPSPGTSEELTPLPEAGSSPSPGEGVTPRPSPGPVGASSCSNQQASVARQDHDSGALRGDIDGDGGYEVIWLAFDRRAEPGCQVFLAATSGSMTASLPIVQPEMDLAFFPPALNGLAPIDTDPGLEVVVDLVTGASTRFVGVFGAPAGVWNRVEVAGSSTRPANLFAYGGSVAHLDGVDCARPPGTIVLSSASPKANRYLILSRYYRVAQGRSTPLPARTTRQVIHAGDLDRFPELASAPFAGCT